jgi:hypothetical protein
MADDVNHHSTVDVPAAPSAAGATMEPVADRRERARRNSYRLRFGIVYAVLGVVVVGALAAFAVLVVRDAPSNASGWSSWQPTGNAVEKMQQVTDRIPQAYVTADNEALNIAVARQLVAQVDERAIPVGAIVIGGGATAASEDDAVVHDAANAVSIALCGLGPQCSIPGGDSSDAGLALRRQAVELSLYAFKYVDEIDSVVVFLPPSSDGDSGGVIYLRRDDLREELKVPLDETLPTRTAQIVGDASPQELSAVVRLTDSRLYSFSYEAAPDGNPILVLTPA